MGNETEQNIIPLQGEPDNVMNICLLMDRVKAALRRHDSVVPDSLGDRLFRSYLQLTTAMHNGYVSQDTVDTANDLLAQDEQSRRAPVH